MRPRRRPWGKTERTFSPVRANSFRDELPVRTRSIEQKIDQNIDQNIDQWIK